jgi:hypothetical protein
LRAPFKKLNWTNPGEDAIAKAGLRFIGCGVAPEARSSSWLARRLRDHATKFLGVESPEAKISAPVVELQVEPMQAVSTEPNVAKKPARKKNRFNAK